MKMSYAILAGVITLTSTAGAASASQSHTAHAAEKKVNTSTQEGIEKSNKDTSKPIEFNKAQNMSPKERVEALTKEDKRLHNHETEHNKNAERSVQATNEAGTHSNINNYIKKHNIKPAKIKEDARIDNLPKYSYKSGKYLGVAIHETANPYSTLDGEVNFMYNNWQNAFVHGYTDYKEIRQTAPADYLAWGAGANANPFFYQIELVRAHSTDQFARSVNNQAYLTAYILKRNGLKPKLADTHGGSGTVISHNAISRYYGGTDHTDPISYFNQWGYSMNQFYELVNMHYDKLSGKKSTSGQDKPSTAIKGDSYKVRKGDTVYSIAQRSGKSIKNIEKWNNIKNHSIKPGQTLKLKDTSKKITSKTYTVQKGDTLYNISKRSGISINKIKDYNNLKSNTIVKNQKLYLAPTYDVKKGNTLYSIARKHKTSVNKLKTLNGLKSNTIKVGQKLILK